ncbi:hypothetical protein [Tolypothrix sp. NIES-4075]|uniref:hypothetical protein n=1 Tax=Tolypothrix sp. NIES-4075 TaxID=2005459 RepID=UPI001357478B|nr:hypothetical protein [Tolypothrix sp. NIES-4075]
MSVLYCFAEPEGYVAAIAALTNDIWVLVLTFKILLGIPACFVKASLQHNGCI